MPKLKGIDFFKYIGPGLIVTVGKCRYRKSYVMGNWRSSYSIKLYAFNDFV